MTSRTLPCALALVALLQGCGVLPSGRIEAGYPGDRPGGSAAVSDPAGAALSSTRQPPPASGPSSTRVAEPSPLSVFRSEPPAPVQGWREANDRVGRIGGWRAYTQEAQAQPGSPSVLQDSPRTSAPLAPLFGSGPQPVPGASATRPDTAPSNNAQDTSTQTAVGPQAAQWQRTPEQQAAAQREAQALLREPLTSDGAVQVALLMNPGLQAALAGLGVTEAEARQASRLPNPGLSLARLREGGEREIERGLHLNLARLLLLPAVSALEARRLEQARAAAAIEIWQRVSQVQRAHIDAVAARERARYMEDVLRAARASAELTRRAAAIGNVGRLQQSREQAFHAEAALSHARAVHDAARARERLIRAMGLAHNPPELKLPERLPGLPAELPGHADLEQRALETRIDVLVGRLQSEQSARSLGLTRTTRFINVLELGAVRNDKTGAPTQTGWEISLELPLFDWGESRVARAEALYLQSLARVAESAALARSEVREAWGHWRFTHEAARHVRDEILPVRRRIADENLLRYNGMLIGVHELLADARDQISASMAAIDTLRDFWLADADLRLALLAPGAMSGAVGTGSSPKPAGAGTSPHAGAAAGGH